MHRSVPVAALAIFLVLAVSHPSAAADRIDPALADFFEKDIRPLLAERCWKCHGKGKNQGNLELTSRAAVLRGGDSGPAVEPGKPEKSLLIQAVRHENDLKMPPNEKLREADIDKLTRWVKLGVPWPEVVASPVTAAEQRKFWSFQPVRPAPPKADLDHFILAAQEAHGLKSVRPADKRTLIRRATFDLIGLPPTPQEIADFLADESPDAFAKVVDRLLASPHYGERWGRHWLDVVRYADTAGDNSDYPIPQMYRYRNWVIEAFNRDLPYDQFVRDQLAGDLLPARDAAERYDHLIATGYLANARRFGSYEDARYPWYLTIEDTIDNLGRTFLGLTINCSRCHDHKFDPLTTQDYYALYGIFASTRYPFPGIELDKAPRDLIPLAQPEQVTAFEKERREKLDAFDATIKRLEGEKAVADRALKEAEKDRVAEAVKRVEELVKAIKAARQERETFAKKPVPFELAYAVAEGKNEGRRKVGNARVQIKGDPERPGEEVPRRFPTVLGGQALPVGFQGSGRLELARWITDPANPLTARVLVNRLWHYHFGKGIVQTPSDFGRQGRPPTHPELLDYLAGYFTADGGKDAPAWSIKKMHRLIMLSRTYQLSSEDDTASARIDADNAYLWRFSRRRLDAESIRDTMLTVSGALDRSMGGPHPFPAQTTWDYTQHKPFKAVYETNRRSVYLMTQRIQRHPFLALFDGADTNASSDRRTTSTTPLQALYLMNDPFVHEQSRKFALRLLAERTDDRRIELAYLLALGRSVTDEERTVATEYLARVRRKLEADGVAAEQRPARAWESFARVMFVSNEFVYVN